MATCKDCVHYKLCGVFGYVSPVESCGFYTDRARFVEIPYAEWIEDEDMHGDLIYHCSNCNEHFVLAEGTPTDNCYFYCPNCGAKMGEQALKERTNDKFR